MRGRFNRTICDTTTGIIVPFARVEVFEQVSGDKPDLFSVETGGLPISNPMIATSLGFAGFFLDPGQYRFVASTDGGTIVSEITHEVVVDPNANDGIFENIVAETFRGREIILEDISYGRVLVRDIADNTHYAEFKYEAPGNRATLSRTGYIHFDMSPSYVGVYDQVGAPILRGETTRTRLYRGGAEVLDVTNNLLELGFSSSLIILDADISGSSVRVKNPNGTYPLSSAGGTLSLERPDGVDVLVSNSGVTNLASYNGGNLLTSTSSITALYAPAGSVAFDATPTATHVRYANGNPFITAGTSLGLQYENGANLLIAGSPAMVLCNPSGSGVFSASTSSTSISSPAATVLSATTTTTTIYAGNGTQAIAIDGAGAVTINNHLKNVGIGGVADADAKISAYGIVPFRAQTTDYISGSTGSGVSIQMLSGSGNTGTLIQAAQAGFSSGSHLCLNGYGGEVVVGGIAPQGYTMSVNGGLLASNFYGNGFSLTQLSASNVVNGTLPGNIFPATISTSQTTLTGGLTVKSGTTFNIIEATGSNVTLRDYLGNTTFFANGTDLNLKRANNTVLNASATATQLFNHAGSIRANFDASDTQIFAPSGAPFISATTSTAAITSGNGAACLSIDSTGAGLMRFPVYTVATVPSAAANADRVIIVSNASLGRGLYTSDATNWRSAQSGTILS